MDASKCVYKDRARVTVQRGADGELCGLLTDLLCYINPDVLNDFQVSFEISLRYVMAPVSYPTKEHIAQVFSHVGVGDYDAFFSYVVPDVGEYIFLVSKMKILHHISLRNFQVDDTAQSSHLLIRL